MVIAPAYIVSLKFDILTFGQAEDVYKRQECGKVSADAFVYYTPEDKKGILREIFGRECVYRKQCEGNLGLRMYRAMKEVLAQGYDSCVLIGTDIPELTSKEIQYAFRLLDIHDIVFGPCLLYTSRCV